MIRTQVHLTERESEELAALSEATGETESELIRRAIDSLIEQSTAKRRDAVLQRAAGIWKDRDDLPDFNAVRSDWNRG